MHGHMATTPSGNMPPDSRLESTQEVLPLPELPPDQTGTSVAAAQSAKGSFKAEVSNKAGYMCHIALECTFKVPPEVVFGIFTHPDNSNVFRDIKGVGSRKLLSEQPGYKLVEVEQLGELRILWMRSTFTTLLTVEEDARDPQCLKTAFHLKQSDVLSRFTGAWELHPVRDEQTGVVVACAAVLHQDVLPKGMPPFLSRLPVLGGLLRRASLGTIRRLVEDIFYICERYEAAGPGANLGDVLDTIARERAPKGAAKTATPGVSLKPGPPVHSFAVGGSDLGTEEEEEDDEMHACDSGAAHAHASGAPAGVSAGAAASVSAKPPPRSPSPEQVEAAVSALERVGFS